MTDWADLNARARGLGTHLLGRSTLEGLARARDLAAIASELERRGYPVEESARGSAARLELTARRVIAARFRTLIRWAGNRTGTLAVLFEDEDRRSIAALLRGAVQRAPAEQRLSGLLPTPELPERALEELARQPGPGPVAALLHAWRHPLAPSLPPGAGRPQPDLLQIETALSRSFAARAVAAARRAGRRGPLLRYVQQLIDVENACTALILSEQKDARLEEFWLAGGRQLTPDHARRAMAGGAPADAARVLAAAFAGSRLAAVFAQPDRAPAGLEAALLGARIAEQTALARTAPLSPAPLLAFALRLRAEALDVRRIVWGISLGTPTRSLIEQLVTAP